MELLKKHFSIRVHRNEKEPTSRRDGGNNVSVVVKFKDKQECGLLEIK